MRALAVGVLISVLGAGLGACSSETGFGECPDPEVLAAAAEPILATSCVQLVSFNGIDYSPGCGDLPPSRVGPVIDRLKDPSAAVHGIVGVEPDHAVAIDGPGCGDELEVLVADGLTPTEEMYLRSPEGATGVAQIRCSSSGDAHVVTPLVWGRVDGIHVEVANRTDSAVFLSGLEVSAESGVTRVVSKVGPGKIEVGCSAQGSPDVLRVKDSARYWTTAKRLECSPSSTVVTSHEQLPIDPTGDLGNPRNVISEGLEGVDFPEDNPVIEGWVGDEVSVVRVARRGVPIARFELTPTDEGGWTITRSEICSGSDIRFNK
jgi:hypothetical protein